MCLETCTPDSDVKELVVAPFCPSAIPAVVGWPFGEALCTKYMDNAQGAFWGFADFAAIADA